MLRELLAVLSVPQLEELRINGGWNVTALTSFFSGLSQPLKTLSVRGAYDIRRQELLLCLRQTPWLASLSISSCISRKIIRALTPTNAHPGTHLCPHLTSLNIRVTEGCSDTELGTMIESRCLVDPTDAQASALQSVHIDFESYTWPTEDLMCCFDRLKAEGLHVTFKQVKRKNE